MSSPVVPWGTQTVTRRRRATGAYAGGTFTQGAATDTVLTDVRWTPAPDKVLERLPEGLRSKDVRQVFTQSELRVAKAGSYEADEVSFDGGTTWFEVQNVRDFSTAPFLPHYEAVVIERKETE